MLKSAIKLKVKKLNFKYSQRNIIYNNSLTFIQSVQSKVKTRTIPKVKVLTNFHFRRSYILQGRRNAEQGVWGREQALSPVPQVDLKRVATHFPRS